MKTYKKGKRYSEKSNDISQFNFFDPGIIAVGSYEFFSCFSLSTFSLMDCFVVPFFTDEIFIILLPTKVEKINRMSFYFRNAG